jgi:hypothetical protein
LSVGVNEYSCPHFGQKPASRFSGVSQEEQKRLRSGTTPGTTLASGSTGGSAGRARGRLPSWRVVLRPVRIEPERVERVERVLRLLRVDGVRPEPVRVEAVAPTCALAPLGGALPQTSQ